MFGRTSATGHPPRSFEKSVVSPRSRRPDAKVVPRGTDAIGQEREHDARVRVHPQARLGEAQVSESTRAEECPCARHVGPAALPVEASAQGAPGTFAYQPLEALL